MKIVFPVRFAAHQGAAVQTTSAEMTDSRMLLMCPQHRAPTAALVALQLYLPDSFPPAAAMGRIGAPAGKAAGGWLLARPGRRGARRCAADRRIAGAVRA